MQSAKNPITNLDGSMNWERFLSFFGVIFALIAFFVGGFISDALVHNTFVIGGMFGLSAVTILIYGFVFGLSFVPLALIALYGLDPMLPYACGTGVAFAVLVVFLTSYEPPFPKLFWNWVRSRETPGQKRVV